MKVSSSESEEMGLVCSYISIIRHNYKGLVDIASKILFGRTVANILGGSFS